MRSGWACISLMSTPPQNPRADSAARISTQLTSGLAAAVEMIAGSDKLLRTRAQFAVRQIAPRLSEGYPSAVRPGAPGNGEAVPILSRHSFQLPFHIDPKKSELLKEVVVYMSDDEGASWREVARADVEEKSVIVTVPSDGLYWFTIATVDKQGKQEPSDLKKLKPEVKVIVQTEKK